MSERWQIRRGTTQENDDFTGAQGELTMDTQKKQLRVHDGSTLGGKTIPNIDDIMAALMPNFASGVGVSFPYTAPSAGYITGVLTAAHSENYYVAVNGVNVQRIYGETNQRVTGPFMIPVKKGDIISATGGVNTLVFFPCIGF